MGNKKYSGMILIMLFYFGFAFTQNLEKLHYDSAVTAATRGNFERALSGFEQSLAANPAYSPAIINADIIKKVLQKKFDEESVIHYFKGIEWGNKLDLSKKIAELNQAIELNKNFAQAYNERGISHANRGHRNKALEDYNKVIELLPDYAEVYYNKAVSCDILSRFPEALDAFQNFVRLAPANYIEHLNYARTRIGELKEELAQ